MSILAGLRGRDPEFSVRLVSLRSRPTADTATEASPILESFLLALGVIFVAELGDKSQLMALTFATRHPPLTVLVGISVATLIVHAGSVLIGHSLAEVVPLDVITVIAAVSFFAFALWTLRGDSLDETEEGKAARVKGSAIVAVGVAFFLAELGDKTMLATVALSTREEAVGTWLGSTVGMVAADALAIVVGRMLGKRLPEKAIKYGAAAAFAIFGAILLASVILK